nr:MAG TPA: TRAF PROTEIN, TRAO PROTEIN, TRAN ADHESION, BACTERIAL SECRETION.5A [Caudoviricetes sp.]
MIKDMKKYMVLTLLLAGCASTDDNPLKTKVSEFTPIPDTLLLDCEFPPPPEKSKYIKLSAVEKEKTLMDIYLEASQMNEACNIRLKNARIFQENMKKLISGERSTASTGTTPTGPTPKGQ